MNCGVTSCPSLLTESLIYFLKKRDVSTEVRAAASSLPSSPSCRIVSLVLYVRLSALIGYCDYSSSAVLVLTDILFSSRHLEVCVSAQKGALTWTPRHLSLSLLDPKHLHLTWDSGRPSPACYSCRYFPQEIIPLLIHATLSIPAGNT